MKNSILMISALALVAIAPNAYALKVTNLDDVPHTVVYHTTGEDFEQVVAPQQSVNFHGKPDGLLSLKAPGTGKKQPPKPGVVHADGLLSGIVGAARDTDIPAAGNYDFVIWQGGRLQVQHLRENHAF